VILKVVSTEDIRPSTYNPRQADPERLELVKLSLSKLGWLLPIYADAGGEILSGHQRHYVATEMMGMKEVPVAYTKAMTLPQRKAINIAFNRGTNDMESHTLTGTLADAIRNSGVVEMAENLPDAAGTMPILNARQEPINPILKANTGRWSRHAKNVSRMLIHRGVEMPVIVNEDNRVINGIGRLEQYAILKYKSVDILRLPNEIADVAEVMLNLLTMDFDLHRRYSDELRYNSFRRAYTTRKQLGVGMTFAAVNSSKRMEFDILNPTHASGWKKVYGTRILDFGAGHLWETEMMRKAGCTVSPFEPYHVGQGGQIDKVKSMDLTDKFLSDVATGVDWDTIFLSSVLNSVPFEADRFHIVQLLNALAQPTATHPEGAQVCAVALSTANDSWRDNTAQKTGLNKTHYDRPSFRLDHEPGVSLADFLDVPKIQKYHSMPEFQALFASTFGKAQTNHVGTNCQGVFRDPLPVNPVKLAAAIDFEFELPYPDGTRMERSRQARAAFEKRLGITLPATAG
jgi:hypothetical protein